MDRFFSLLIHGTLLFWGTTFLTGCSLMGYSVGAGLDQGQPGEVIPIPDGLMNLPLDTRLIILMKDGSLLQGSFDGLYPPPDTIPPVDYEAEFEKWRTLVGGDSCHLPAFDTPVQIVLKRPHASEPIVGRFAGFNPGKIRLLTSTNGGIAEFDVQSVKEIRDSLAGITTQDDILRAFAEGAPCACGHLQYKATTDILLGEQTSRPLAEVQHLYIWRRTNARWTGFGIGLLMDASAVALALSIISVADSFSRSF